jgi:hypothetical protein
VTASARADVPTSAAIPLVSTGISRSVDVASGPIRSAAMGALRSHHDPEGELVPMRVFYDTEFLERGPEHPIELISIGMVAEDGRELYAVNADLPEECVRTHDWLSEHVWPHLPLAEPDAAARDGSASRLDLGHPDVRPRARIARLVAEFLERTPEPELWAWYGAYDHVVLTQLWRTMVETPDHVPKWTNDLRQEARRLGDPVLPRQPGGEHHALADARHNVTRARALGLVAGP